MIHQTNLFILLHMGKEKIASCLKFTYFPTHSQVHTVVGVFLRTRIICIWGFGCHLNDRQQSSAFNLTFEIKKNVKERIF